jgi:hypothetical protein
MGGLAGLVRGIAIGSVPRVIASCAAVFGAGPSPPVRPRPGREVRSHPLCIGPKFHFGEWIQFDGRLESGVESCSLIAGSLACSESSSPSSR